jgi:hypothetical protein
MEAGHSGIEGSVVGGAGIHPVGVIEWLAAEPLLGVGGAENVVPEEADDGFGNRAEIAAGGGEIRDRQ